MPGKRTASPASLRWTFAALAVLTVAVLLAVVGHFHPFPELLLRGSRWVVAAVLLGYGVVRRSLLTWIFVCMVIGGIVGYDFPPQAAELQLITQIFLRLIKTIIAPLIFSTLVVGIAGHSDMKQVGRMGIKALIFFEVITTLALVIGLIAINVSKAGVGLKPMEAQPAAIAVQHQSASDIVLHIFPENIAKSIAEGQVLQVVVFALIFALALSMLPQARRAPMLSFCESLSETMFKFTNIVMLLAAPAVGAAIAYTIGQLGVGVLSNLLRLLGTLYVALIAFIVLVLIPTAILFRIPLRAFTRSVSEPAAIAFATTSSEAALPRAMEEMEALGVPKQIVAFVIPTGYSFNLAGSALYLSLAAIFVAQAANIDLSWQQQAVLLLTLMLTSKGVAGVPRAGLVILLATVGSFNLPLWPVYILLGVDALLDMGRTAVNVIANCLASVAVAKWEGEFPSRADARRSITSAVADEG
ncbi:MAG: cation:dicarboxylase symporter family transporter [Acidobacteria bacterium]|nr:cation:dicarboxylase symporter family transporter [Acidobacteriota bacterium]